MSALLLFEAAGRPLSFSRARDELHVTQSAVSRSTLKLENRVGLPPQSGDDPSNPGIDLVMTSDWSETRVEYLCPDVRVPVCSRNLMDGSAPPVRLEELRDRVLLHNATRPRAWPDWLAAMGMAGMAAKGEFWYRHFFMALKAAREGCGIALIPRVLLAGS